MLLWQRFIQCCCILLCPYGAVFLFANASSSARGVSALTPEVLLQIRQFAPTALRYSARWLTTTLRSEAKFAARMKNAGRSRRKVSSFRVVQSFLGATPLAKRMSYSSFLQTKFLQLVRLRFNLDRLAMIYLQQKLPSLLSSNNKVMTSGGRMTVPPPYVCPYPRDVLCDESAPFRTFDGSCNNRHNPLWGASFQPLNRFLRPDYADGIDLPRISRHNQPLPNARLVSLTIHDDKDDPSPVHTLLFMLFGQFTDHDMSRTAISKLSIDESGFGGVEEVMCGDDGCQQGTLETQTCFPIFIPEGDPVFLSKRCLEFVRTLQVPDSDQCSMGPRQQLNQITSYLDASHIYASTAAEGAQLRDLSKRSRGRLSMRPHPLGGGRKNLLPPWEAFTLCQKPSRTITCFRAGDGRVNEHLGLMTLHTIFAREHNRIEAHLRGLNPHWHGERLYEETRRIVGAMWQRMVYGEYLPLLLGQDLMDRAGLSLTDRGYANVYNPHIRPDVANSFTTAAFRYGHSQIQHFIQLIGRAQQANASIFFSQTFRSPHMTYSQGGPDMVLRGFLTQFTQKVDAHITSQVTEHLFTTSPPLGLGTDLIALNIQRGRDHGLPGYTRWRKWCRLDRPRTFNDLKAHMPDELVERFRSLYRHVDDIDLFPAGLAETPSYGAIIGPTFACIIATQFRNLKRGDRFWHENIKDHPYPFSPDQLDALRKASLAKMICDNADDITIIQPKALLQPFTEVWRSLWERGRMGQLAQVYKMYHASWNERVDCSSLPSIDLTRWLDPS